MRMKGKVRIGEDIEFPVSNSPYESSSLNYPIFWGVWYLLCRVSPLLVIVVAKLYQHNVQAQNKTFQTGV